MQELSDRIGRLEDGAVGASAAAHGSQPKHPGPHLPADLTTTHLGHGAAGACASRGPSLLQPGIVPGPANASSNPARQGYEESMAQARRLMGGQVQPPPGLQTEPRRQGRERQAERDIKSLLTPEMQGDPHIAVQLAMLEALQNLSGDVQKRKAPQGSTLEELLYGPEGGSSDEDMSKLLSGAKGSAALMRLNHAIESDPQGWTEHFNATIWRALGSDVSGLPWSVQRYSQERIRWGKLETHERAFSMMASLHSLAMRGEWQLLTAKVCQYLKALEQSALMQGGWRVPWLLTGLQDPRPGQGFGRGLVHAAEVAAASAYVKEMRTLEEAMIKEQHTETGGSAGGDRGMEPGGKEQGGKGKDQTGRGRAGGGKSGRGGRGEGATKETPQNPGS
eukprot:6488398-Amphidinium_carterae.1